MAAVRSDSRGTAGESREHDDRAERGKKNGSHDFVFGLIEIRKQLPGWVSAARDC
jgi:hypothetical protein